MLYFYDNYNFTSNYSSLLPSGITNILPSPASYGKGQLTGTWQRAGNGEALLTIIGYDRLGFLNKKTETGLGRQLSITDFENNLAGMITSECFRKYKPNASNAMECLASGSIENNYSYPHTKLLCSSVISMYDKSQNMRTDTILHLTYDSFGNIATNNRGGTVADMTYGYDQMHGWLKSIKSGGSFEQKLYRETEGSTPCYNGNISAMTWRTGNDYVRRFDYKYNGMNWLTKAIFSYYSIGNPSSPSPTLSLIPYVGMENEDYTSEFYYDRNGNMTGAYRQGLTFDYDEEPFYFYDTMDDYYAEYYGNQKRSVNYEGVGTPYYFGSSSFVDGLPEGDNEYAYNANGAMTMDLNKGITDISYDLLDNISEITFSDNRNIRYVYAADGTRLRTVHSRKVGNTWLKDSTDYCGSLILKNGQPSMYHFAGGYLSYADGLLNGCHYYIQDYLGSNRMVVNKTGAIEQITHYYPYGGVIGGIDCGTSFQNFKFEGKEFDRTYGLDWYDIHARQYDPVVPSWHKPDPLAEKYYWISPYAYCANNPVNYIDLYGDSIIIDEQSIIAIFNGLDSGYNVSMKFNNGVLDPSSISQTINNTTDFFLKDLYEIAIDKRMVELRTDAINHFLFDGKETTEEWSTPYDANDYDLPLEAQSVIRTAGEPLGKHIQGNLGQALFPGSRFKQSVNDNIQIIINGKGSLNARSIGIAHEFGHVLLYLRGLPSSHGQTGVDTFVYGRASMMSKRLGYDY